MLRKQTIFLGLMTALLLAFSCTVDKGIEGETDLLSESNETRNITVEEFVKANDIVVKGDEYIYEGDIILSKAHINSMVEAFNREQGSRGNIASTLRLNDDKTKWIETGEINKWSPDVQHNLTYSFPSYEMSTLRFTDEEVRNIFKEATLVWMEAADVVFREVPDNGLIKVKSVYDPNDRTANGSLVAARAHYPNSNGQSVTLNTYTTANYGYYSMLDLFIHELGHTLGLAHEHQRADSPNDYIQGVSGIAYGEYDPASVMHYGGGTNIKLSPGDKEVISYLYGKADSSYLTGDFNADGRSDLLRVYNKDARLMSTNLSHGSGSFSGSFDSVRVQGGGWDYYSKHVADVNGDGKDDLVRVFKGDGQNINVFFSKGDGTFAAPVESNASYGGGWGYYSDHVVDVNGDGKADVVRVYAGDGKTIYSYLSNGDGTFAAPVESNASYGGGWNNYSINWGDINGDGKADLVRIYTGDGKTIYSFLSNGDGTFAAPVESNASYGGGWNSYTENLADVNGDGKVDVVRVYNGDGTFVYSFLSNGDGTFATPVESNASYGGGWDQYSQHFADVNGDGKTDLVRVFNGDGIFIYSFLSNGDGTFNTPVESNASYGGGWGYYTQSFADIDNDGKDDLLRVYAVTGALKYSFISNGDGTFSTKRTSIDY